MYAAGRSAVAHANADPVVDPDHPEDTLRLQRDLPLIKALAAFAIEHDLGVKSQGTVWREHLYEL
ncbi:MAG: methylamine utilization protein MauJ, partial [Acidimicrobiia bacterium]